MRPAGEAVDDLMAARLSMRTCHNPPRRNNDLPKAEIQRWTAASSLTLMILRRWSSEKIPAAGRSVPRCSPQPKGEAWVFRNPYVACKRARPTPGSTYIPENQRRSFMAPCDKRVQPLCRRRLSTPRIAAVSSAGASRSIPPWAWERR